MRFAPDILQRRMLGAALSGAAALVLPPCAHARVEFDPTRPKMTKARAQYKDEPEGIHMCMTCTLYLPPTDCKVVEGPVSAAGWCNAFDMAD
jgi:hypothetical protein